MGNFDAGQLETGTMNTNMVTEVVNPYNTDGAGDQEETTYQNTEWSQQWAYFNEISDLKGACLMKVIWDCGKGWDADVRTTAMLENIKGYGKDTFDDVLFNVLLQSYIGGDGFAEIIKDDLGQLVNLKPLDPGSIVIVADQQGIIKRYEQTSKIKGKKPKKFEPKDILHLSNNRAADQIHGISVIKSLEKTILAELQSFTDMEKIMRRQARPLLIFKLKTDNSTVRNAIIQKIEEGTAKGEHVYIPDDESIVSFEQVAINVSDVVLAWRQDVRNKFYRGLGLPLIIFGNAGSTESGGKIEYLAHEQVFEFSQRRIEKQLWLQLRIRINLIPPVTLLENLQNDESKDAQNALTFSQGDVSP